MICFIIYIVINVNTFLGKSELCCIQVGEDFKIKKIFFFRFRGFMKNKCTFWRKKCPKSTRNLVNLIFSLNYRDQNLEYMPIVAENWEYVSYKYEIFFLNVKNGLEFFLI